MANKNVNGDVNVSFTEAASRQTLDSGESVKILFGKLRKWLSDLKPVAFSGSYNDLSNKPTLGTASAKDVPLSGNASTSQVVMGNDSRLSDSRPASDVSSWAKASTKPTYTASEVGAAPASHTQASSTITAMTGYTKPSSTSAITASDTLNAAIGKLEKGLESAGGGTILPIFINKISWKTSVDPSVSYYVKFYYEESKLESNPITFRVIGGIIGSNNSVGYNLFTACITKGAYKVSNINGNNFTIDEYSIIGRFITDNIDSNYRYYYPDFWNSVNDSAMLMTISGKNVYKYKCNTIIHSIMPIDFTAVTRVTYNDITIWERT